MSAALALATATAVTGCGGGSQSTQVLGEKITRTAGCSGWFEVEGDTLVAHVSLAGAVRELSASATFTDGRTVSLGLPVQVRPGTKAGTFRFPVILDAGVDAATVDVKADGASAECRLATPH